MAFPDEEPQMIRVGALVSEDLLRELESMYPDRAPTPAELADPSKLAGLAYQADLIRFLRTARKAAIEARAMRAPT